MKRDVEEDKLEHGEKRTLILIKAFHSTKFYFILFHFTFPLYNNYEYDSKKSQLINCTFRSRVTYLLHAQLIKTYRSNYNHRSRLQHLEVSTNNNNNLTSYLLYSII